jgi:hypothetical protein
VRNNESVLGFLFTAIIMAIIGVFTLKVKLDTLREEAVQKGFAEWVVDASGETEWRWKGGSDE